MSGLPCRVGFAHGVEHLGEGLCGFGVLFRDFIELFPRFRGEFDGVVFWGLCHVWGPWVMARIEKRVGPDWVIGYEVIADQVVLAMTVFGSDDIDDALEEARRSLDLAGKDWYRVVSVERLR